MAALELGLGRQGELETPVGDVLAQHPMFQPVVEDLADTPEHPFRGFVVSEPDGFNGRYHVVTGDAIKGRIVQQIGVKFEGPEPLIGLLCPGFAGDRQSRVGQPRRLKGTWAWCAGSPGPTPAPPPQPGPAVCSPTGPRQRESRRGCARPDFGPRRCRRGGKGPSPLSTRTPLMRTR